MTDKYYAVCTGMVPVPITELDPKSFAALPKTLVASIPVYFCPGMGFWPEAASTVEIAKVVPND